MEKATPRPPKQDRSRRTLQRIARGALELIAQNGVEATTVGAIARRAGSSVGSFYARFEGKSDLLVYLDERIWETVEQRWSEARAEGLEDPQIEQLVRGLARLYADLELVHRGARDEIGRVLRGPGAGPSDAALRIQAKVRDDSARLLLRRREEMIHPTPTWRWQRFVGRWRRQRASWSQRSSRICAPRWYRTSWEIDRLLRPPGRPWSFSTSGRETANPCGLALFNPYLNLNSNSIRRLRSGSSECGLPLRIRDEMEGGRGGSGGRQLEAGDRSPQGARISTGRDDSSARSATSAATPKPRLVRAYDCRRSRPHRGVRAGGRDGSGDPPALRGRLGDLLRSLRRSGRAARVPGYPISVRRGGGLGRCAFTTPMGGGGSDGDRDPVRTNGGRMDARSRGPCSARSWSTP